MILVIKKYFGLAALLSTTTITLAACGGGSKSSDPGTPTTLVTSLNGQAGNLVGKGLQFINPILAYLAGLDKGMVQVSTPWTNTSTNRCFATAAK
jgi:ABC-type phosphate transport system substrate-binding protein